MEAVPAEDVGTLQVQEEAEAVKVYVGADPRGEDLKRTLVDYLNGKGDVEVVDLGTDGKYYSAAEKVAEKVSADLKENGGGTYVRGLLVCGTGMGMSIIANKYQGIYAAPCESEAAAINARSINNINVLTLGGALTSAAEGKKVLDAFLNTDFKAPAPVNANQPWDKTTEEFLENSVPELAAIPRASVGQGDADVSKDDSCPVCFLHKDLAEAYEPAEAMRGAEWKIVRKDPTSAFVRFKAGAVEPLHHHTYGHDLVVLSGQKRVENETTGNTYDLGPGDYLFISAGHKHRVTYFTDTKMFLKWDGPADIFIDEPSPESESQV